MKLEKIVRPFQLQDVTPARRVPPAFQSNAKNVELSIGRNGSGKVMHGSENLSTTLYMDTKLKETKLA